jgi:NhaP-type Na+/H+ or K+/H+ antiporter
MTQTQRPVEERSLLLSPAVTAAFGFVVYALSAIAGNVFELNADSHLGHTHTVWESVTGMADEYAIGLIGVAIAVWAGRQAWRSQASRLARTALILAVVAALTFPAYWAGWSNVFGAVAVGLALEHRRRVGSLGAAAATAFALGALAFVASAVTCVLG